MAIAPPPRPQQRSNMMDQLGLKLGQASKPLPAPAFEQTKKEGGHGIFDIPIIGPIIDVVDTPRAIIVSAIKEVGDIFDSDNNFSLGEFVSQARDNMMMGEVLRDWDVDPGGWQGFALGLGLDVALDPLTYMAGAGLLARTVKPAVASMALRKAATVAEKAKNFKYAGELSAAANKVDRTGSVLSAGKHLDAIGISSGARFTIPGTGKLGRWFLEKPLRKIFPVIGKKLDDMRVNQLVGGSGKAGPGGWFRWGDETGAAKRALDLTNPNNLKLVRARVAQLRGTGPAVAVAAKSEADKAARIAMRMAVEMPGSAKLLAKIPGSTAFVAMVAAGPGKAFGAAANTKMGNKIGEAFNTNVDINVLIRSKDPVEQVVGRRIQRLAQSSNTAANTFVMTAKTGVTNLKRRVENAGHNFDEVMLAAEAEVPYLFAQGNKYGIEPVAVALRAEARAWLDSLRPLVNDALPHSDDLEGIVGELWLMRYLGRAGGEKLDELGRLKGARLPKNPEDMIQGNSFNKRNWITPSGIKELIRRNVLEVGVDDIDIDKLRVQLGISDDIVDSQKLADALDSAIDDLVEDGFKVEARDGHVYTNKTHVGTFKDGAGPVRDQLTRMGKEAYGDNWVNIFDTDFSKQIATYIDQHARYIRSQHVIDGLAQQGIVVRGANGVLYRAAAERLTRQSRTAGNRLTKAQAKKNELEAIKTARDDNLNKYTGEAGKAGSKTSKAAAEKAAIEVAVLEGEMEAIASVMRAIENGSGIEGLSNDAMALISPGGAYDLRKGVGYISQKVRQTADEAARLHAARSDAVEMIHVLDDQIHQFEELLKRIEAVQGINPELQGFMPLFDSYKEIQDMVNVMREGLRNFKSTFINRMLDDVTVRAADDMEDFLNAMSADGFFDFARNGKRLASVARKDELGRISKRLGEIFADNPKWKKWLEDMPELAELKHVIENLDEGDMGILARLDRYRTIKGGKPLLEGESPIGTNIEQLLSDIGAADRNLLNAKMREIEDILTRGLRKRPDRGVPYAKQTVGQVSDETTEALQESFDLLGAKFEELEIAMNSAQKKLLETEAYLAERRTYWRGKKELTEDELTRVSAVMVQQQKIVDDLKLEKLRLMDSDATTIRISAQDSQQAAVSELRKVRNLHNLSDAYDGRLNDYMVNMVGLGSARDVSNRTNNLLRGYSLVGGAGESTVELFSAAVQAAARTADTKAMSEFMRTYSTFLNWWKAQAVSTPGFVLRNMMGGMWINNQIADVPMGLHGRVLGIRRAAKEAAKEGGREGDIAFGVERLIAGGKPVRLKGKLGTPRVQSAVQKDELEVFLGWYRTGMSGQGQVTMEVMSELDNSAGIMGALKQGSLNPFRAEFKPFAMVRAVNQDAEFMLRGALAHHVSMGGGSLDDAFAAVTKYHFDYAHLTQTERKMKQVIPFWTWQKNVLPVLVESIGKKPAAWGRLAQVKKEMELHSPEEGLVPSWFGENMSIRLPFTIGGNRAYTMPDLPFRDLAKWSKSVNTMEPWRPLVESALPLYKLPIEMWAGKQYFSSIPFSGRYQQVPYAYEKIPGLMNALGGLNWAKKNSKGDWKMTDKGIYIMDQFSPVLGRLRRLFPNEKAKQERVTATWISTVFGTNVRLNTRGMKRGVLISNRRDVAKDLKDKKDIENRTV